jgi:hypothetical protein
MATSSGSARPQVHLLASPISISALCFSPISPPHSLSLSLSMQLAATMQR